MPDRPNTSDTSRAMHNARRFAALLLLTATLGACASGRGPRPSAGSGSRQALAKALADAERAATSGLNTADSRRTYNEAVSQAVAQWQTLGRGETDTCEHAGRRFALTVRRPRDLRFDDLLPVPTKERRKLNRVISREGVGVPFVARWDYSAERRKTEPFLPESGYLRPAAVTIDFREEGSSGRSAVLRVHDVLAEETALVAGHRQPLAADYSAVSEVVLREAEGKRKVMSGLGAMVRSEKYLDKIGLLSLEPPSRDRIPVIFVHGLMSKPLTWHNAFNELGADPVLRQRYQLYFFRYPTGVPVVYSAAKFRAHLETLHDELARIGNHRAAHHMVLIGHSMGGLVSKLQVADSGDRVWISVFGAKPGDLKLPKEEIEELRQYMEFRPNPNVDRVIFICTPHRGSKMAEGFVGAMGRRLASLPFRIIGAPFQLIRSRAPVGSPASKLAAKGAPSSIENLSPNSLFIQESIKTPLKRGLHIHSIVGNKNGKPLTDPKCSDGVVPYSSAHLAGVESELVLRSNHGAHERPEAIAEIRRILLLHLATVP